ncbi:MAG TPA: AIR carboxylase family protein, partial [Acidobacteria bacterium]|nr:AIR carboxylase family protein [Acidobacteriota bacterium]
MNRLDVAVLMGSASDWPALRPAVEVLRAHGLAFEVHVTSAHRTPERTVELVRRAEAAGVSAFICAAGMAAHLAGAVAALTTRPVL